MPTHTDKNKKEIIKVMHFMHTYLPKVSGVAINTHNILNNLSKHDSCISLVFAPKFKNTEIQIKDIHYKIIRFSLPPLNILYTPFVLYQLIKTYKKEHFDILHCHGGKQIYLGYLFKKIIPSITLVGMFRNDRMLQGKKKKLTRFKSSVSIPSIDKIVSINPVITDSLIEYSPALKEYITEIPLGVDLEFYDSITPDLSINKHKYLIYVGRLTKSKGIDILIRAFNEINKKFNDIFLYIVGLGKELDSLKILVHSLGLDEKVQFLGIKTGSEKISLIKKAEFFVFPSFMSEGLPGVLLEALACKKIVIATRYKTVETLIQDGKTGLLSDVRSHTDLALKMEYALKNKIDLEKSLIPNVEKMMKEYDINIIADKYIELYKSLSNLKNKNI